MLPHVVEKRTEFDLFFDEAGHTGGNLVDANQPIFVHAGWILRHVDVLDFENIVGHITAALPGDRSEIKGSRLLNSNRGRTTIADLIDALSQSAFQVQPVFCIWEKRFGVAIEICDTLINPLVVPQLDPAFDRDTDRKIRIANEIYALPDDLLQHAWKLIRLRDSELIQELMPRLASCARQTGGHDVANLLTIVGPFVNEALELQRLFDSDPIWSKLLAPNAKSFVGLLDSIEKLGRRSAAIVSIYHDDTQEFRGILEAALTYRQGMESAQITLPNGNVIRTGYESFRNVQFVESRESVALQAADVLASLLRWRLGLGRPLSGANDRLSLQTSNILHVSSRNDNGGLLIASDLFRASVFN